MMLQRSSASRSRRLYAVAVIVAAAVSAVLVVLRAGGEGTASAGEPCWDMYPSLAAPAPSGRMGVVSGRVVRDVRARERTASLEAGAASAATSGT
jgi:hypothetical protein